MLSNSKLLTGIAAIFILNFPVGIVLATPINPPLQIAEKMVKLEGTKWQLIGFVQSAQFIPTLEDTTITIEFEKSRFAGTGGCNRYNGGYQRENNTFSVTPIASTFMACPPEIMDQEVKYFQFLNNAQTYRINEQGQLEIKSSEGVLVFESKSSLNDATSWLNIQKPQNWNQAGASIPTAPTSEESSNLKQCIEKARKPSTPEDEALIKAGWTLFGAIQVYGDTTVRLAMSDADGMCRPMGYQEFVFVDGKFAGTLSPILMNSRSDGSAVKTYLTDENSITTIFNRYDQQDALCCPSRTSNVSYLIENKQGMPVVIPQSVYTSENKE